MTEEEVAKIVEEMRTMFSTPLPDPEHEPIRAAYYLKLYKHMKASENKN